jgi:hypothetical protein
LEWYYADNEFSPGRAWTCHEPIEIGGSDSPKPRSCADLGCAIALLIRSVGSDLIPWGIDISSANIAHAQLLTPRFSDNFVVSDIFDDCVVWTENHEFQLVILSLVRLTEVDGVRAEKLLRRIREHAKNLLSMPMMQTDLAGVGFARPV